MTYIMELAPVPSDTFRYLELKSDGTQICTNGSAWIGNANIAVDGLDLSSKFGTEMICRQILEIL